MAADLGEAFIANRRPPFFRFAWRLYWSEDSFRGLVDFAVIGMVVLFFLDPSVKQSVRDLSDWASSRIDRMMGVQRMEHRPSHSSVQPPPAAAQAAAPRTVAPSAAEAVALSPPAPSPLEPLAKPDAAAAPAGGAEHEAPKSAVTAPANETLAPPPAPPIAEQRASADLATPPAGAEPSAAKTSVDVPMPLPPGWKVPRLLSAQFLIEIDEAAFRSSTPDDQGRLKKAVGDYHALRFDEMIDDLTDASSSDANVLFLRALGVLRQSGSNKFAAAHGLLQASVSGGQRQAAIVLGILLVAGPEGVDKDLDQGKNLIETAAVAGDRMAQRAAGIGEIGGEFGSLDPVKGVAWIRRAAEAGDAPAMVHYGFLLSIGSGVEKNTALAEDYVRRAAVAGLTAAQETLGAWIVDRYKSGLAADPGEGVRWLKRAYELGFSTHALVRLGVFYADDGRGAWRDRNKSFALFGLCIGYASSSCQFAYAWHLANGFATRINPVESYARYEVARQLDSTKAPERLQALQRTLSPGEEPKAIELATSIRGALRPIPTTVVLQYPGARPQPSPWPVTASSAPAAASSRR